MQFMQYSGHLVQVEPISIEDSVQDLHWTDPFSKVHSEQLVGQEIQLIGVLDSVYVDFGHSQ